MENAEDHILKIKEKVLIQEFKNESIILNIETGKYFEINNTGKIIISLIKKNQYTEEALIKEFKKKYDSDETVKDIKNFIERLLHLKILEAR